MLTFRRDNSFVEVAADRVVLALSFSILRRSVDLSRSGLSQLKLTAIHHLSMGTNSKLHLQFDQRRWSDLGCTDDTYSDTGYQNTWEVSRAQTGASGIPVGYTGGRIDAGMIEAQCRSARDCFSCKSNRFCPGLSATYNGKAALEYWTGYPWTRGSYSFRKVGQYTTFEAIEGKPEGNCHFCGEHTLVDFKDI